MRDNENYGVGGINPGYGYIRSEAFALVVRSGAPTEEDVLRQISLIPNFAESFKFVII